MTEVLLSTSTTLHVVVSPLSTVSMRLCRGSTPSWFTTRIASRPLLLATLVGVRPCTIPSMTTTA